MSSLFHLYASIKHVSRPQASLQTPEVTAEKINQATPQKRLVQRFDIVHCKSIKSGNREVVGKQIDGMKAHIVVPRSRSGRSEAPVIVIYIERSED
jgi:hypothetical protein